MDSGGPNSFSDQSISANPQTSAITEIAEMTISPRRNQTSRLILSTVLRQAETGKEDMVASTFLSANAAPVYMVTRAILSGQKPSQT
jgi:hypothetical protein